MLIYRPRFDSLVGYRRDVVTEPPGTDEGDTWLPQTKLAHLRP